MSLGQAIEPTSFAELMQAMPAAWTVVLGVALVVGLVLWVFGGRLAKNGVMLTGFVAGGLGAAALATALSVGPDAAGVDGAAEAVRGVSGGNGLWILGIGIGGAIAGVLLAALLFRFWMAGMTAVLLAAVVPIAGMIWEGNGPPLTSIQSAQDVTLDALGAGESLPEAERLRAAQAAGESAVADGSGETKLETAAEMADALFDQDKFVEGLRGVWATQVEEVKVWWRDMEPGPRRFLVGGAGVGAVVGLVLGLVMPMVAASLQSAMVGSVLILFSGRTLLLKYVPGADGLLPSNWRGVLLSLGLITLLGVLIQWTMRKKKSDE
ncbi:MAG: hypothetical protein AAF333_00295 [Planctomycetota bacterium]